MATAAVTYAPSNGDENDVTKINQDFTDVVNFLNNNVVHADGAVAMTGALTLPGDPSTATQAATKAYVDARPSSLSSYTPTWTQGATISKTINHAYYVQLGKLVVVNVSLTAASGGTNLNAWELSLPVAHGLTTGAQVGTFGIVDPTQPNNYVGVVWTTSGSGGTTVRFVDDEHANWFGTSSAAVDVASGSILKVDLVYFSA